MEVLSIWVRSMEKRKRHIKKYAKKEIERVSAVGMLFLFLNENYRM